MLENHHVRSWHHDIPHLHLGHLEHPLKHRQLVLIQHLPPTAVPEQLPQVISASSLSFEQFTEAAVPTWLGGFGRFALHKSTVGLNQQRCLEMTAPVA